MERIAALASLLLVVLAQSAAADNPIVQTIYPADPAPVVRDGVCYLYTSHDGDDIKVKGADSGAVEGASGVHDRYVVFTGGNGDLFDVNGWTFQKDERTRDKPREQPEPCVTHR